MTLRNKLQWNRKWNPYIFIQENAFGNVVWKKAAILSRPQFVNSDVIVVRVFSVFTAYISLDSFIKFLINSGRVMRGIIIHIALFDRSVLRRQ